MSRERKDRPSTLGELKQSGYSAMTVREEMRRNLIEKLRTGEQLFPGIIGYEDTVIPQLENAILAGQDIIFLGERGQAKSRMIRSLVSLLDAEIPVVAGCEINDSPLCPRCKACREKLARMGDMLEVAWLPREARYAEKLATPDVSVADLIGDIDPIKVAEGRYLSDEGAIHYGLIPRSNRGIFAINELPDLPERIQVGLFNLMEEQDIQIRGHNVRLPLDVYIVASANPEDYTNRGRIITPLKDRFGARVRTHYPRSIQDEIRILDQERTRFPQEDRLLVPVWMKEIVAEITLLARQTAEVNQRSGVSVRASIANYETLISNALRRSILLREERVSPRITDLPYMFPSFAGKVELEGFEEDGEQRVLEELTRKAVLNVFQRYVDKEGMDGVMAYFSNGFYVDVGSDIPSSDYAALLQGREELAQAVRRLGVNGNPEAIASAVEFLLEGLHLSKRLTRKSEMRGFRYGD